MADRFLGPRAAPLEGDTSRGELLPPLIERFGLAEVEHNPRNNRMRAI